MEHLGGEFQRRHEHNAQLLSKVRCHLNNVLLSADIL